MSLDAIELWLWRLGAVGSLATLAVALARMFGALRQPAGREEPAARRALRAPPLAAATILFLAAGVLLWRPLPVELPPWLRAVLLAAGGGLLFGGLALYLWGLRSLGRMFGPASGFGVRLHAAHRLVTTGPYRYVRHPMYSGVVVAGFGSLLLYHTWATLCFAVMMLGLAVRAWREEKVLAQEFGAEWEAYRARVPAWLPRLGRKKGER